MGHDLTHASWFSGVGGLDLGLERAGWRTVSFSEIDPYASAVLAERWPGVPNLGDITDVAGTEDTEGREWHRAVLWTGGFPCQDLSVAGKRRGMGTVDARTRSGLAFAFLDLVEQHRPPAILLENVPGLLSSNGGKDFGALLGRLGELGYWWAYRILDAQFFGVPQRRRRVFICALHAGAGFGADSPAEVLSVGTRCDGHSAAGHQARTAASDGLAAGISRALSTSQERLDADTESFIVRSSADPGRMRAPYGLAGRSHDRQELAHTLTAPNTAAKPIDGKRQDGSRLDRIPVTIVNALDQRRGGADDNEAQAGHLVSQPIRTNPYNNSEPGIEAGMIHFSGGPSDEAPLLPLGLDSHRYRCCGNGVVSNVSEWIGVRLARVMA